MESIHGAREKPWAGDANDRINGGYCGEVEERWVSFDVEDYGQGCRAPGRYDG